MQLLQLALIAVATVFVGATPAPAPDKDVTFSVSTGDAVTEIDESKIVRVDFDDEAIAKWKASHPADSSNTTTIAELEKRAEWLNCYHGGTQIDRDPVMAVIDNFCTTDVWRWLNPGDTHAVRYTFSNGLTFLIAVHAKGNGCGGWHIPPGDCYRKLHTVIDSCNTDGYNNKQGGEMHDDCGMWRGDPGRWQTDCNFCHGVEYARLAFPCYLYPSGAQSGCFSNAASTATSDCQAKGQCCPGSGLGSGGRNCDIWGNDD